MMICNREVARSDRRLRDSASDGNRGFISHLFLVWTYVCSILFGTANLIREIWTYVQVEASVSARLAFSSDPDLKAIFWKRVRRCTFFDSWAPLVSLVALGLFLFARSVGKMLFRDMYVRTYLAIANLLIAQLLYYCVPTNMSWAEHVVFVLLFALVMGGFSLFIAKSYEALVGIDYAPPSDLDRLKPVVNVLSVLESVYKMRGTSDAIRILVRVWSTFRREEYDIIVSSFSYIFSVSETHLRSLVSEASRNGLSSVDYNPGNSHVPAGFGDNLREMRNMFEDGKVVKNSKVIRGLKHLGALLICTSLGRSIGIKVKTDMMDQDWIKKIQKNHKMQSWDDYLFFLGDVALSFCEVGYALYMGDSLRHALLARDPCFKFFEQWDNLKAKLDSAATGEIVNLREFCDEAERLLQESRSIPKSDMSPLVRSAQQELSRRVMKLRIELASSGVRKLPFGILLYGDSGIGKSTIVDHLFDMYYVHSTSLGHNAGLTWDRRVDKYTRGREAFWNGYNFQWALVLDDVAWEKKSKLSNLQQTTIDEVIQVMNNVSYSTDQAAIEDKGTKPLLARCVVATTNTKDLNAYAVAEHPAAVLRRFPIVLTPHVKPQYRKENSHMLNPALGHQLDAWTFTIEEVTLDNNSAVKHKEIFKDASLDELSDYLRDKVDAHEKIQSQFLEYQASLAEKCKHDRVASLCGTCKTQITHVPAGFLEDPAGWFESRTFKDLYWMEAWFWYCILNIFGIDILIKFGFSHFFLLQRYYAFLKRNKYVVAAAALATAIVVYQLFSAKHVATGNVSAKKKENIWYKDLSARVDLTGPCSHTVLDSLAKALEKRSLFHVHVTNPDGSQMSMRALGIKGQWIAAPSHLFNPKFDSFQVSMWHGDPNEGISDRVDFLLDVSQIVRRHPRDLLFFTHPAINHVRDMSKFFLDGELGPCPGTMLYLEENRREIRHIPLLKVARPVIIPGYMAYGKQYFSEYTYNLAGQDIWMGSCGSPILIDHPAGSFIAGIQASMDGQRSKAIGGLVRITKQDVDFLEAHISAGSYEYATVDTGMGEVTEVHEKSPFRHKDLFGKGIVLGSFTGRRKTPKSRTIITPWANEVKRIFGTDVDYGAPVMKGFLDENNVWIDPMLIAIEKRVNTQSRYSWPIMVECREAVLAFLLKRIDLRNIYPVGAEAALNGIDGEPYINKIDRTTSGGFRFPGRKIKYLDQVDGTYEPNADVQKYVDFIEECYLRGERANVMFDANLKDEAIPREKIEIGKTRVFTGSPLDLTIVMRKQFLRMCAEIMENGVETGIAAGVNCYTEWTAIFKRLISMGGRNRASGGDHKSYDTAMDPGRLSCGMWVFQEICRRSGNFSENDLQIQRGIAADLAFPVVNMNGDIVQLFGTNCSGHALTLMLNCIVNMVDTYFAYRVSTGKPAATFEDNVILFVMGDDSNFTTSPRVEFGHTDVQNVLASIGLEYTMADKTSESVRYLPIEKLDFLKRRFLEITPDLIYCPLEEESIFKMLTTVTMSKVISPLEQFGQIIEVANREWAMHGPVVWRNRRTKLMLLVNKYPEVIPYIGNSWDLDYGELVYQMTDKFHPDFPFDYDERHWVPAGFRDTSSEEPDMVYEEPDNVSLESEIWDMPYFDQTRSRRGIPKKYPLTDKHIHQHKDGLLRSFPESRPRCRSCGRHTDNECSSYCSCAWADPDQFPFWDSDVEEALADDEFEEDEEIEFVNEHERNWFDYVHFDEDNPDFE
ncbi:hypothetical protein 1 [Beihai picorna-like virus 42]|uniref:hypothetical protein 1 n=1 Tax=Beihai picorna-like virus 42 TaxID=1922586 RepID=UPI00090C8FA7|nr:hypothetical protein 1 [Beihai picorna-like virus 42]APG78020.1 hypothetical protein 1 [Beihai picorna-like virus 42]